MPHAELLDRLKQVPAPTWTPTTSGKGQMKGFDRNEGSSNAPRGERGECGRGLKDGHHQGGKGCLGLYVAAGFGVREGRENEMASS